MSDEAVIVLYHYKVRNVMLGSPPSLMYILYHYKMLIVTLGSR
jgi:hypothetical protein